MSNIDNNNIIYNSKRSRKKTKPFQYLNLGTNDNNTKKSSNQSETLLNIPKNPFSPPDDDESVSIFQDLEANKKVLSTSTLFSSCNSSTKDLSNSNNTKMPDNTEVIGQDDIKSLLESNKKMAENMAAMIELMKADREKDKNGETIAACTSKKEILHASSRVGLKEACLIHPWLVNTKNVDSSITKVPTNISKLHDITIIKSVCGWIRKTCTDIPNHQSNALKCIEFLPEGTMLTKGTEDDPTYISRILSWLDVESNQLAEGKSLSEVEVQSKINDVRLAIATKSYNNNKSSYEPSFSSRSRFSRQYDKKDFNKSKKSAGKKKTCHEWNKTGKCGSGAACTYPHICQACIDEGKVCDKPEYRCRGGGGVESESED